MIPRFTHKQHGKQILQIYRSIHEKLTLTLLHSLATLYIIDHCVVPINMLHNAFGDLWTESLMESNNMFNTNNMNTSLMLGCLNACVLMFVIDL